ncbi:hypothetical protein HMI54_013199, partial [Coelomomyces lativittatus]
MQNEDLEAIKNPPVEKQCLLLEHALKQLENDFVFNLKVIEERDEELRQWEEKETYWQNTLQ